MHEESIPQELLASLDRTAERFSGQPVWRSLAERAREALACPLGLQADDGHPSDGEKPQQTTCWCCGRHPPGSDCGLCDLCEGLYERRSARVVAEGCDCGHSPESPHVYIYTPGRAAHVLCGQDCVRAHWRRLFGFFLRRSP